jgi:hypothetical protein
MKVIAQVDTVMNTVIHTPDFSVNDIPDGYVVYEVPLIEVRTDMPWMVADNCFKYGNLTEYQILAYPPVFQPVHKHMEADKEYLIKGTGGYSIGYVGAEGIITEQSVGEPLDYIILGQADTNPSITSVFLEELDAPPIPKAPVVDQVTMNLYVDGEHTREIYNHLKERKTW